jgi:hypothetical protein
VNDKKTAPPSQFVEHLTSKISAFPLHRFLSKHQKEEEDKKVKNLRLDECFIKRDFAEKVPVEEFNEVQT